jgi:hypothetical protein
MNNCQPPPPFGGAVHHLMKQSEPDRNAHDPRSAATMAADRPRWIPEQLAPNLGSRQRYHQDIMRGGDGVVNEGVVTECGN